MSDFASQRSAGKWWLESQLWLMLLLVGGAYLLRSGSPTMRGEEPRRARVAFEMKHFNDWLAPREQGEIFSRPPLHNWLIYASTVVFNGWDPWIVRFPSVMAMVLISALLYGYARLFFSRTGALMTALVFPTMGEMFQTGRQAETEAVFFLFVSASLLLWHWGYVRNWRPVLTWSAGYGCLALASLCKGGMQPPVYFLGTVGAFLLLSRNLRFCFSWSHLGGLAVGAAIIGAWLVPFWSQYGWDNTYEVWMGDTASRFKAWSAAEVLRHLGRFPCEVLGCMMPWSILLLAYCQPSFLRWLRSDHPEALFVGLAVAIAFPTCWLPPGGQTRYFAPLYPCLAVLIGFVIQSSFASNSPPIMKAGWRRFSIFMFVVIALAAAGVPAAAILLRNGRLNYWSAPAPAVFGYAVVFAALAWLVLRYRNGSDEKRVGRTVLAISCFMMALCAGFLNDLRARRSVDTYGAIAKLKQELPPQVNLVSLDHIDALFAYHYGRYIEARPWPPAADDVRPGEFFCFNYPGFCRPEFPFPWVEIESISMDRNVGKPPERVVVVGRRLPISGELPPTGHSPVASTVGRN